MTKSAARIPEPETPESPDSWWPDFRVKSIENTIWQVVVISRKGSDWASTRSRSSLLGSGDKVTTTDLASVNHLIGSARNSGLKIEYVGPHQVVRF